MSFNIWERWPWTSFQNLNLDWLMKAVKEAVTSSAAALAKATAVEADVGTYTDQITAANNTANQAMNIARNADDVLFIYSDSENKAVDYKQYTEGVTTYITAPDIFSAVIADHKFPVFMDTNMYFYDMAGYETNPEQPLMVTRVKFVKDGVNRQDIVWIDRNGSITYTHIDGSGNGFPVVFNYIPQNPELPASGYWDSDKTYAEILAAINSGMSIFLTVKIDGETRELINNAYISKSSSSTYIALGYSRGFDIFDSPYYTNTENLLVYYTINSNEFVSVQRVFTVPPSSAQITGRVLTVNSSGKAEWLPPIGGDGSYSPYLIPVSLSGGVYSTTATGEDVYGHILDCRIVFNGVYYYPIGTTLSGTFGDAYFACSNPSVSGTIENDIFAVHLNGDQACTITKYDRDLGLLPIVSSADAGKFARVNSSGAWVAEAVPSAESNAFGGA